MSRHGSFSESVSSRCARTRRAGVMILTSVALASCASIETTVPPVASLPSHGRNVAALDAGRRIYLESCTRCHVAEPVREYPAARWPGIIADMAERSKLSAEQERAVLAYVLAATQAR